MLAPFVDRGFCPSLQFMSRYSLIMQMRNPWGASTLLLERFSNTFFWKVLQNSFLRSAPTLLPERCSSTSSWEVFQYSYLWGTPVLLPMRCSNAPTWEVHQHSIWEVPQHSTWEVLQHSTWDVLQTLLPVYPTLTRSLGTWTHRSHGLMSCWQFPKVLAVIPTSLWSKLGVSC